VELSLSSIKEQGKWNAIGILRDITERKRLETLSRRDENRQRVLLELNEMSGLSSENVLKYAVEESAKLMDSGIAYMALLDDAESVLTLHYWADTAMKECLIMDKPIDYPIGETGLWGEAVRQRKPVITNSYGASNPDGKDVPVKNVKIVRHINIPFFEGKRIVAVVGLANKETDYVEEDVLQLTRMMEGAWNIFRHKKAEEAIREMNQSLIQANEDLKGSMAQLVQAEKMTALGELTAGIAHELNQPLNVIKIICQGILRDIEKNRLSIDEAKSDLPEIMKQTNKMAELITHMRIFTRSSGGTEFKSYDVNALISDALKFITQQYRDHDIEVIENFTPDLPPVMVDQIRLEQVILNLLNNARYAVENSVKNDKKIEIRTQLGASGNDVVMEVIDNGIGIPEKVKTKLFQPFFTTKEAGKGTGLGLSVCSKIIAEFKGKIEFESREGEGATFRVILPACA
jgi:signal transduction histidine kinase